MWIYFDYLIDLEGKLIFFLSHNLINANTFCRSQKFEFGSNYEMSENCKSF